MLCRRYRSQVRKCEPGGNVEIRTTDTRHTAQVHFKCHRGAMSATSSSWMAWGHGRAVHPEGSARTKREPSEGDEEAVGVSTLPWLCVSCDSRVGVLALG